MEKNSTLTKRQKKNLKKKQLKENNLTTTDTPTKKDLIPKESNAKTNKKNKKMNSKDSSSSDEDFNDINNFINAQVVEGTEVGLRDEHSDSDVEINEDELPTIEELKNVLANGNLSKNETSVIEELLKDFEAQDKEIYDTIAGTSVDELKEILNSDKLDKAEKEAIELYIQQIEASEGKTSDEDDDDEVEEDDDEEEDNETFEKHDAVDKDDLDGVDETLDGGDEVDDDEDDIEDVDVTDEQMLELLESGDLNEEEEAEIQAYFERRITSDDGDASDEEGSDEEGNDEGSIDLDAVRDMLEEGDLNSEDEKEMRAYLEMKEEQENENPATKKKSTKVAKEEKNFAFHSTALLERYEEIRLDQPGTVLPWIETMTVVSKQPSPFLEDPELVKDDLKRELAFYQQALSAVKEAKQKCLEVNVPFSRPDDYFAEMVKSDAHMQRVRQNLVDEAASIKRSEEARKLRAQKKFGKKVQVEKVKERQIQKRNELEKVKILKKKRGGNLNSEDSKSISLEQEMEDKNFKKSENSKRKRDTFEEDFDVQIANESNEKKRSKKEGGINPKRKRKDEKFGFGGKKRWSKSNTAESTEDFENTGKKGSKGAFNQKKMKAGIRPSNKNKPKRMGKAKRQANRK
ncbi:rRNA-processing protein and EBNA1-binding protein ebp2 [Lobulomyces angularis]|nr:rRNA-processing protein and EBNA1-binding protein ebp2 [Lobulomyces angularis]